MIHRNIVKHLCLAFFLFIYPAVSLEARNFVGMDIEIALNNNAYIITYFDQSSEGAFTTSYDMEHQNGAGMSLSFGKIFDCNFTIDTEITYKFRNDREQKKDEAFVNTDLIGLIFNSSYFFQTQYAFHPKIELGFGAVKMETSGDYRLKSFNAEEYAIGSYLDTEIAVRFIYQMGIGIMMDIEKDYQVGIGYRFNVINQIGIIEKLISSTMAENSAIQFEPDNLKIFNFEFSNHSLDLNFRYIFS